MRAKTWPKTPPRQWKAGDWTGCTFCRPLFSCPWRSCLSMHCTALHHPYLLAYLTVLTALTVSTVRTLVNLPYLTLGIWFWESNHSPHSPIFPISRRPPFCLLPLPCPSTRDVPTIPCLSPPVRRARFRYSSPASRQRWGKVDDVLPLARVYTTYRPSAIDRIYCVWGIVSPASALLARYSFVPSARTAAPPLLSYWQCHRSTTSIIGGVFLGI